MHQFVQITDAQQTPYITENGYQKVIISLKSVRRGMDLWGRITLEKEKPYTVYIGRVALGDSKKNISVPGTILSDMKKLCDARKAPLFPRVLYPALKLNLIRLQVP